MSRRTLDPDVFILDQLSHACYLNGGVECQACEIENLLAEDAPAEHCRHFQGPECEWCEL